MKTLTKTIGGNRPETDPAAIQNRGQKGSTIVAVMAAMVFIGIVVASMLKNTGSQAAVSRGYGSVMDMNAVASNGTVATETFMQSTDPGYRTMAVAKLQDILDFKAGKTQDQDKKQPYVFGDKNRRRQLGSKSDRYFRSQILDFNGDNKRATIDVESSKSGRGKSMAKTRAFYLVDVKIDGKPMWNGMNAMMLNMNLQYASGNIHVKGHSTFMEKFALGASGATFTFERDEKGEGSVFFNKEVKIEKNSEFMVPTFFNDNTILKGYTSQIVFHEGVGFNKHVSTDNYTTLPHIGVMKDVWVKEGFKTVDYNDLIPVNGLKGAQGISTRFKGMGTEASNMYYTDHFPLRNPDGSVPNSPCINQGYAEWECQQFDLNSTTFPNINYNAATNKWNFSTADILEGLGMNDEAAVAKANAANPGAAAAQSRIANEPDLNPTNITNKGKEFLTLNQLEPSRAGPDGSLSGVSINDVKNWYTKYPESQYPQYYSEGHLLVKVTGKIDFASTTEKFDSKIAFSLEGAQANISGKYFDSNMGENSNASTLIYLGEGARLNMFGCNDFRGLIYMDETGGSQNQQSTFDWGPNSRIDGAVLLKGKGRINWNGGDVTITKNDAVLAGYSGFITPKPGQNSNDRIVTIQVNKDHVGLTPLGYYFGLK